MAPKGNRGFHGQGGARGVHRYLGVRGGGYSYHPSGEQKRHGGLRSSKGPRLPLLGRRDAWLPGARRVRPVVPAPPLLSVPFHQWHPGPGPPPLPYAGGEVVQKAAMVSTIIHGARLLGIQDAADGSERVTGHSLRPTGAQGLIALGWRQDAVRLMGRWLSETVTRYTRNAALYAPSELASLIVHLCGIPASAVPDPPTSSPEPAVPDAEEWVLNAGTDKYHLVDTDTRARCGWDFSRNGVRGSPPPPGYWHVCSTCAPALRRRLKEQAKAAGEYTRDRAA